MYRKAICAAFFILFSMCGAAAAAGPAGENIDRASADYVEIATAVEYYFEAGRKGDSFYMKQVFLPEANIYGISGGKIVGGPIQLLYDMVEGKPSPTEIVYRIAAVDIARDIATVRLEIADWAGNRYIDMFTMIKGDEGWRIASKVSIKP